MDISNVAVIGLGTMGAGIVEVFAKSGYDVVGIDVDDAAIERGRKIITTSLARAVEKGKLEQAAANEILGRVAWTTDMGAAGDCQLVVEAAFENLDVKKKIFGTLDEVAPGAVLATNSSSLSITDIAEVVSDPSRVLGVHFFNPAPVQKLVEVISTRHTAEATVDAIRGVMDRLGKAPIYITDRAGFVVNALLVPYINRAVDLYGQGFATREEIDEAMLAAGMPMGPLTLTDLIGNDVSLAVMERMYSATGDGEHAPAPLLSKVVADGLLGRKSGRGFYAYDGGEEPALVEAEPQGRADELPLALVAPYLNDACRMVEDAYATEADINTGMEYGCRMPKPFVQLREIGAAKVLEAQERVAAETGYAGHAPSAYLRELAASGD